MTANESALPPTTLTNETISQRIIIGGSKPDAAPPRGSLAKAATRFRELLTSADVQGTTASLRSDLDLHDLEIRRLFLSARAYDAASSKSRASLSDMTFSQTSIQNDIEQLTGELNHQKRIRRNIEEYNTLAKIMNVSAPAAAKSQVDLKSVQDEIARTKKEMEKAQWEISIRERQVRALMTSLGDLTETLRDEDWRKRNHESISQDDYEDNAEKESMDSDGDDIGA